MAIIDRYNQPLPDIADPDSWNGVFFDFIEDMIAQGWRVLGSGDGLNFENSGQKLAGAASGFMRAVTFAELVDGEIFTLDDGTNTPTVFEFDTVPDGVTGGNVVVDVSGDTTVEDVRDTIIAAINGVGVTLTLTALPASSSTTDRRDMVLLQNDVAGASGNTTSSETVVDTTFHLSDMTGGGSGGGGSGGVFHVFTSAQTPVTTFLLPSTPSGGTWGPTSSFDDLFGATWLRLATPVDADHYLEYLFQIHISGGGTGVTLTSAMCRGTQRFNAGAGQWTRPNVDTGTAIFLGTKRRAYTQIDHPVSAFHPSSQGGSHWVIGDKSLDYDFFYFTNRRAVTQGFAFGMFGRFRTTLGVARNDSSVDPDPYVQVATMELSGGSTSNDFFDSTFTQPDITAVTTTPERLEDRVLSQGNSEMVIASYCLDEPDAIADGYAGHYSVAFCPPAVGSSTASIRLLDWIHEDRNTLNSLCLPFVPVARVWNTTISIKFWKGVLKNTLLCWGGRGNQDQKGFRLEGQINAANRLSWGVFSLYWDNNEPPKVEPE